MPHYFLTLVLCVVLFGLFVNCIDDPYKVLGVSKSATQDEIKKVYKNLALKWHPDKNPNSKEAEEKFVEITTAYEILTDDEKRREFEQAKYGQQGGGGFGGFNFFYQNVKPIYSQTFSLTYDNYDTFVTNSEELWIIQFYTDRCAPCIAHAPAWEQTAKSLSDFVHFGRVNADEQGGLFRHFRVRSIPSVVAILGNGNMHSYYGSFDVHSLSDFVKRLIPSQITQLNNHFDWEKFRVTNNNKPNAVLFSSHASSISPLYKFVSSKYSHLFNFAQVTGDKLDTNLATKYEITTRPSIIFFTGNSENPRVVPGSFTKDSLITILEENKYLGTLELTSDNFFHLCGRKSTILCGIIFTTPKSGHFTKHLQIANQLPDLETKIASGWIDSSKFSHFLSFFNISIRDTERLHNMLIWDGAKRKYALLKGEINSQTLSDFIAKKGSMKFLDIPHDVPLLVEPSGEPFFDFSWILTIIRFIGNNFISVLFLGVVLFRMVARAR